MELTGIKSKLTASKTLVELYAQSLERHRKHENDSSRGLEEKLRLLLY